MGRVSIEFANKRKERLAGIVDKLDVAGVKYEIKKLHGEPGQLLSIILTNMTLIVCTIRQQRIKPSSAWFSAALVTRLQNV